MKTSRIPILFAVNDLLVGGVQRLYLDLFRQGFPGYEVHLLTFFRFPDKQEWFDTVPSDVVVHSFNFKNFRDVWGWVGVVRVLMRVRPGIVISSLFFSNTVTRVLGFMLRIPVIAIEHNTYTEKTLNQQRVDRLLAHTSDCVVAVSKSVLEFTANQEQIPKKKFILIQNGIDLLTVDAAARVVNPAATRTALGLKSQERLIIAVGRLTAQKNHRSLIEGFVLFHKTHPEYLLAIAGEGSLKKMLQKLISTRKADMYIRLLGTRHDVIALFRASDFFVSTSHIEGFPLAHAEALRSGLPVLTTRTAGADEMIIEGENGLFLDASSPERVAEGFKRMLTTIFLDPAHITASVERFSITATAAAYRKLIADAIAV